MATFSMINGRPIIQIGRGAGRRTISLGGMSQRQGRSVLAHVENILSSKASGSALPVATAEWLRDCPAKIHAKLVKAKLAHARTDRRAMMLGHYFDAYIARRTDLKPRSIANLSQVKAYAVKHFGETRDMRTITRGDVKTWHRAAQVDYAEATVAMHVKKMRELWRDAIDHKLLDENVFGAVKVGSFKNPERLVYVPRETVQAVIDKTDDWEWKLVFSLARFGGLRIPSELLTMQTEDFGDDRFIVRENKTKRRAVPIFPELSSVLGCLPTGAGPVFRRLGKRALRTQAMKLIKRAGVKPWPKLFQNLRASCETDLVQQHPLHVVVKWIGNSEIIAHGHYLTVTDADYDRAVRGAVANVGSTQKEGEQMSQNQPISPSHGDNSLPPRGEQPTPGKSVEIQQANHEALYAALHPVERNAEKGGRQPNIPRALKRIAAATKGGVR